MRNGFFSGWLLVPADKERFFQKLPEADPDRVVFDLEDAVSPGHLPSGLENLRRFANDGTQWVRPRLHWCGSGAGNDLPLLESLLEMGYHRFVIPKCRTMDDVAFLERFVNEHSPSDLRIVLLAENPQILLNLPAIRPERLSLEAVSLGAVDYCLETGMQNERAALMYASGMLQTWATAHGIGMLGSAYLEIGNREGFEADTVRDVRSGYSGKFLLHPDQVKQCRSLQPYTPQERVLAASAVAFFEKNPEEVLFVVSGRLIERAHLAHQRRILAFS